MSDEKRVPPERPKSPGDHIKTRKQFIKWFEETYNRTSCHPIEPEFWANINDKEYLHLISNGVTPYKSPPDRTLMTMVAWMMTNKKSMETQMAQQQHPPAQQGTQDPQLEDGEPSLETLYQELVARVLAEEQPEPQQRQENDATPPQTLPQPMLPQVVLPNQPPAPQGAQGPQQGQQKVPHNDKEFIEFLKTGQPISAYRPGAQPQRVEAPEKGVAKRNGRNKSNQKSRGMEQILQQSHAMPNPRILQQLGLQPTMPRLPQLPPGAQGVQGPQQGQQTGQPLSALGPRAQPQRVDAPAEGVADQNVPIQRGRGIEQATQQRQLNEMPPPHQHVSQQQMVHQPQPPGPQRAQGTQQMQQRGVPFPQTLHQQMPPPMARPTQPPAPQGAPGLQQRQQMGVSFPQRPYPYTPAQTVPPIQPPAQSQRKIDVLAENIAEKNRRKQSNQRDSGTEQTPQQRQQTGMPQPQPGAQGAQRPSHTQMYAQNEAYRVEANKIFAEVRATGQKLEKEIDQTPKLTPQQKERGRTDLRETLRTIQSAQINELLNQFGLQVVQQPQQNDVPPPPQMPPRQMIPPQMTRQNQPPVPPQQPQQRQQDGMPPLHMLSQMTENMFRPNQSPAPPQTQQRRIAAPTEDIAEQNRRNVLSDRGMEQMPQQSQQMLNPQILQQQGLQPTMPRLPQPPPSAQEAQGSQQEQLNAMLSPQAMLEMLISGQLPLLQAQQRISEISAEDIADRNGQGGTNWTSQKEDLLELIRKLPPKERDALVGSPSQRGSRGRGRGAARGATRGTRGARGGRQNNQNPLPAPPQQQQVPFPINPLLGHVNHVDRPQFDQEAQRFQQKIEREKMAEQQRQLLQAAQTDRPPQNVHVQRFLQAQQQPKKDNKQAQQAHQEGMDPQDSQTQLVPFQQQEGPRPLQEVTQNVIYHPSLVAQPQETRPAEMVEQKPIIGLGLMSTQPIPGVSPDVQAQYMRPTCIVPVAPRDLNQPIDLEMARLILGDVVNGVKMIRRYRIVEVHNYLEEHLEKLGNSEHEFRPALNSLSDKAILKSIVAFGKKLEDHYADQGAAVQKKRRFSLTGTTEKESDDSDRQEKRQRMNPSEENQPVERMPQMTAEEIMAGMVTMLRADQPPQQNRAPPAQIPSQRGSPMVPSNQQVRQAVLGESIADQGEQIGAANPQRGQEMEQLPQNGTLPPLQWTPELMQIMKRWAEQLSDAGIKEQPQQNGLPFTLTSMRPPMAAPTNQPPAFHSPETQEVRREVPAESTANHDEQIRTRGAQLIELSAMVQRLLDGEMDETTVIYDEPSQGGSRGRGRGGARGAARGATRGANRGAARGGRKNNEDPLPPPPPPQQQNQQAASATLNPRVEEQNTLDRSQFDQEAQRQQQKLERAKMARQLRQTAQNNRPSQLNEVQPEVTPSHIEPLTAPPTQPHLPNEPQTEQVRQDAPAQSIADQNGLIETPNPQRSQEMEQESQIQQVLDGPPKQVAPMRGEASQRSPRGTVSGAARGAAHGSRGRQPNNQNEVSRERIPALMNLEVRPPPHLLKRPQAQSIADQDGQVGAPNPQRGQEMEQETQDTMVSTRRSKINEKAAGREEARVDPPAAFPAPDGHAPAFNLAAYFYHIEGNGPMQLAENTRVSNVRVQSEEQPAEFNFDSLGERPIVAPRASVSPPNAVQQIEFVVTTIFDGFHSASAQTLEAPIQIKGGEVLEVERYEECGSSSPAPPDNSERSAAPKRVGEMKLRDSTEYHSPSKRMRIQESDSLDGPSTSDNHQMPGSAQMEDPNVADDASEDLRTEEDTAEEQETAPSAPVNPINEEEKMNRLNESIEKFKAFMKECPQEHQQKAVTMLTQLSESAQGGNQARTSKELLSEVIQKVMALEAQK